MTPENNEMRNSPRKRQIEGNTFGMFSDLMLLSVKYQMPQVGVLDGKSYSVKPTPGQIEMSVKTESHRGLVMVYSLMFNLIGDNELKAERNICLTNGEKVLDQVKKEKIAASLATTIDPVITRVVENQFGKKVRILPGVGGDKDR